MRLFMRIAGTLFLMSLTLASAGTSPSPGPSPSTAARPDSSASGVPVPNPSPSARPSSGPSSLPALTPAERKSLSSEFRKALSYQLKALDHQQRFDLKELYASQSARMREWERKETDERHKFFAAHPKGAERRVYVQDFIARRKALLQIIADEKSQHLKAHEARMLSLQQEQAAKLKEFEGYLNRNERPPSLLWPTP